MARPANRVSLREAFEAVPAKRSGRRCFVCVALSAMPEEDAVTLRELIAGSASTPIIFEACQRAGYDTITLSALARHRRRECLGLT